MFGAGGYHGQSESKLLPSMSQSNDQQLATETPPQTPPNNVKLNTSSGQHQQQQPPLDPVQSYPQHQPSNLYSSYNIQSYEDDKSNMVPYANDSISNLYSNPNNSL